MQLYVLLGLFFSLAVAVFAVQNSTAVDVKFFLWNFNNISLVLVIFSSVVGGALITLLFSLPKQLRSVMKIRELILKNQRLTAEIEKNRNCKQEQLETEQISQNKKEATKKQ